MNYLLYVGNWVLEKLCFCYVRDTNYVVAFSNMANCNTSPKALLGEADLLAGQVSCPRSPPNIIASFEGVVPPPEEWIVNGACAYVPQVY